MKVVGTVGIATRPFLLFGVLLFVVGIQAIALGLIGEMIVHLNSTRRAGYRFRGEIPLPRGGERRSHGEVKRSGNPIPNAYELTTRNSQRDSA